MTTPASPPAAWYRDPHDPLQLRWWDGVRWTEHVEPRPTTAAVAPGFPAAGPAAPTAATQVVPQVAVASGWSPQGSSDWFAPGAAASAASATRLAPAPVPPSTFGAPVPSPYSPGYTATGGTAGAWQTAAPGAWPGTPAPFVPAVDASNRTATWALVAGIVVLLVLLFTDYAVASVLAIVVGVKGVQRARAIRQAGHPTAVGMARSVVGLVLSGLGAAVFLLSLALGATLGP